MVLSLGAQSWVRHFQTTSVGEGVEQAEVSFKAKGDEWPAWQTERGSKGDVPEKLSKEKDLEWPELGDRQDLQGS